MTRKKAEEKILAEEAVKEETTSFDVFMDHQKNAVTEARKALMSLVPKGVKEHGQKAVEEVLEGYRQLFNDVVDDMLDRVKSTKEDVNELVDKVAKKEAEPV